MALFGQSELGKMNANKPWTELEQERLEGLGDCPDLEVVVLDKLALVIEVGPHNQHSLLALPDLTFAHLSPISTSSLASHSRMCNTSSRTPTITSSDERSTHIALGT